MRTQVADGKDLPLFQNIFRVVRHNLTCVRYRTVLKTDCNLGRGFTPVSSDREHVPPHVAWAYVNAGGELSIEHHNHIARCESCLELFLLCLRVDNFALLLKTLAFEDSQSA